MARNGRLSLGGLLDSCAWVSGFEGSISMAIYILVEPRAERVSGAQGREQFQRIVRNPSQHAE
jgi:hypothetical protein